MNSVDISLCQSLYSVIIVFLFISGQHVIDGYVLSVCDTLVIADCVTLHSVIFCNQFLHLRQIKQVRKCSTLALKYDKKIGDRGV